ncbi:AAEL006050-PA [Aedes aegypti]|uniref:AAEL006050-PA n=2 Tax=Aedes aegypti TaxID=7159 RepID=A0A1S4FCE6_AEDAE|nr:nuclear RNA export factor 2 [Aedes aegypti]EAT42411.1 AAEL006050-PA [Aedes aegypti]
MSNLDDQYNTFMEELEQKPDVRQLGFLHEDIDDDDPMRDVRAMAEAERRNNRRMRNPAALAPRAMDQSEGHERMEMDADGPITELNPNDMNRKVLVMKSGEMEIALEPEKALVYTCFNTTYDRASLNRADVWHQIMVHHDGKYRKEEILDALFTVISTDDFYPVAYREHTNIDYFLVRLCSKALVKLFDKNLKLPMPGSSDPLKLTVKLNIAKYIQGQIYPNGKIFSAVAERCDNAGLYGFSNMLNLDCFRNHGDFEELSVFLGNRAHLELVCSSINRLDEIRAKINAIKLTNNSIAHISPLVAIKDLPIQTLDLRFNRIKHPASLRPLKGCNINELYIEGNGIVDVPGYMDVLKEYFPKIIKIDRTFLGAKPRKQQKVVAAANRIGGDDEVEVTSTAGEVFASINGVVRNASDFKKYKFNTKWHQVVVSHDGRYDKAEILENLFTVLDGFDFYPCYYRTYSKQDEFFVINCYEALAFLVQSKLALKMKSSSEYISIVLKMDMAEFKDGQVVVEEKLNFALQCQFNDRCLDLCNFQQVLDRIKFVDFSVKSTRTLSTILTLAGRKYGVACLILRLRHNGIRNLGALSSLISYPKLIALDLRFNDIRTFDDLQGVIKNKIKEVFLDNNPVCNAAETGVEYIRKVRTFFPAMEKLDGIPLLDNGNVNFSQNFICTPEAYKFTESFVKHYFSIYDSFQRSSLKDLYHPKAQFSMTSNFSQSKTMDSHQVRLNAYQGKSRNLLRLANIDRAISSLVVGSERIANVLVSFPKTEHDFYSFRVDTPIFRPECVVITVHGAFKEMANSLLSDDFVLGFTRTFYIQPCAKGLGIFEKAIEFKIYNDLFHMYNLTTYGRENVFKHHDEPEVADPFVPHSEERENTIIVFQELTRLNRKWCMRCLEESSWNLKVALNIFLKLYEEDRIPENGFDTTLGQKR